MNDNSAHDPDGFNDYFYSFCWEIIKIDLYEAISKIFAGGKLFRDSMITLGHDTISFLEAIRADICFLGICSIDLDLGITGHHYEECAVKKAMIKSSAKVVALSTPEKLNTAEAFHIAPIQALNGMITSSPENDLLEPYKQAGIHVM